MIGTQSHKVIGGATVKAQSLFPSILAFRETELDLPVLFGIRLANHRHGPGCSLVGLLVSDEIVEVDCHDVERIEAHLIVVICQSRSRL